MGHIHDSWQCSAHVACVSELVSAVILLAVVTTYKLRLKIIIVAMGEVCFVSVVLVS